MTPRQIEREVNKMAVLFEEECMRGQITSAIKFQRFAEQWFEEYAKINLRPTSYARMKQLTKRVYPALGHKRIDKITARDIQRFITDMMINGRNETTGKPLSRKTAVHHLSFISDVFTYAIRMGMLSDNPCRRVFVPKQEQLEKEIFTLDEVRTLFANLDNEPMKYQLYLCLRYTADSVEAKCWDWNGRTSTLKMTSSTSDVPLSIPRRREYTQTPPRRGAPSVYRRCPR